MPKKIDHDFIRRVLISLITQVEDRSWNDVEICAGVMAKEYGVKLPAKIEAKMQRAFAEQAA